MRFKKQIVVPIVLDAEYDVQNGLTATGEGYSLSRSTHIWEVENAGTSRERRLAEGNDDGFLWRLNTYWSFVEVPGGLLIECEAVSLTRDIPAGLGWMVAPVVQQMPRESLKFTLTATRNALQSGSQIRGAPMNEGCEVPMREAILADRRETGFVNPLRVHKALTADLEKRALVWMAWRTPAAINSDHLTLWALLRSFWLARVTRWQRGTRALYGW